MSERQLRGLRRMLKKAKQELARATPIYDPLDGFAHLDEKGKHLKIAKNVRLIEEQIKKEEKLLNG